MRLVLLDDLWMLLSAPDSFTNLWSPERLRRLDPVDSIRPISGRSLQPIEGSASDISGAANRWPPIPDRLPLGQRAVAQSDTHRFWR